MSAAFAQSSLQRNFFASGLPIRTPRADTSRPDPTRGDSRPRSHVALTASVRGISNRTMAVNSHSTVTSHGVVSAGGDLPSSGGSGRLASAAPLRRVVRVRQPPHAKTSRPRARDSMVMASRFRVTLPSTLTGAGWTCSPSSTARRAVLGGSACGSRRSPAARRPRARIYRERVPR